MTRLLVAVALLVALAGCGTDTPPPAAPAPSATLAPSLAEAQQVPDSTLVPGFAVSIPKLGVRSDLVSLGLNADRSIQVPPLSDVMQMGLYQPPRGAPKPGEVGPAIVLAHINGGGKPGAFAKLNTLKAGDRIDVTTPDGPKRFEVYRTATFPKEAFPTRTIYGDTAGPELRLISCGGAYDRAHRTYLSNVIAFAKETT